MPGAKRRKVAQVRHGITAKAIKAWRQGDFHGLNPIARNRAAPDQPIRRAPAPCEGETPWCAVTRPREVELRRPLIELAGPLGRIGRHGEPLEPRK
jgi:hypothetical protein